MNIVLSFSAICLLLCVGKLLRVKIRLFQRLYIPASVLAGLLGLILIFTFTKYLPEYLPEGITTGWSKLPGFLIKVQLP